MATTVDELNVKVTVDASGAIKGFRLAGKEVKNLTATLDDGGKSASALTKDFDILGASAIAMNQTIELATKAYQLLDKTVGSSIRSFLEAESVHKRLSNTLNILGDRDVLGTTMRFNEFAKQLAKTSTVEDEQALSLLRLARQMGLTNERAEQMVQTAADVAASMNEDVTTSFDRLVTSLKGSTRGISEVVPQLANLGVEASKGGKGIEFLSKMLKGAAEADLSSPEAQLKRIHNIIEDTKEAIGGGILKGLGAGDTGKLEMFEKLNDSLEDIESGFAAITGAVKDFTLALSDAFAIVITIGTAVPRTIANAAKDLNNIVEDMISGKDSPSEVSAGFENIADTIKGAFQDAKDRLDGTNNALEAAADGVDKLAGKVGKMPKLPPIISENAKKALEELISKVQELQRAIGVAGASEADMSRMKAAASFQELAAMEKKLIAARGLTKEAKSQLASGGAAAAAALTLELDRQRLDVIGKIREQNLDLVSQVAQLEEFGRKDFELARDALDLEVAKFDLQIKQLEKDGEQHAEAAALLKINKEITKTLGERKIEALEPTTLKSLASSLVKVFDAGERAFGGLADLDAGALVDSFEAVGPAIVDGIMNADLGAIGGVIAEGFSLAAQGLVMLFDPEVIAGLGDSLKDLGNLPNKLASAFNKLDAIITKFIDKAPELFTKLLDAMPTLVDRILAKLPALIEVFSKILVKLFDQLPLIFHKIFEALPGIIATLLEQMPDIILSMLDAVGMIIADLIGHIPDIMVKIIQRLPDIIEAVIEGLLGAMGDIVGAFIDFLIGGGLEKIVVALIKAVPRIAAALVVGIVRGLQKFLGNILSGSKIQVPPALAALPEKLSNGMKKFADGAEKVSEDLFKVIEIGAAGRAKELEEQITSAAETVTNLFTDVYKGLLDRLKELWLWVFGMLEKLWGVLKQVWDEVIGFLQAMWNFLKELWDIVIAALGVLWQALKDIWNVVVMALGTLWDAIETIWNTAITALGILWESLKAIWQTVTDELSALWTTLKDLWDKTISPVVDTLKEIPGAFKTAFDTIIKDLKEIPGKFGEQFKKIIDFKFPSFSWPSFPSFSWPSLPKFSWPSMPTFSWPSLDALGIGARIGIGIGDWFSTNLGNIGAGIGQGLWDKITSFDWGSLLPSIGGGGGGILGGIFSAAGGPVYAAAGAMMLPRGTDVVPAMLSPGEFVMSAGAAKNLGIDFLSSLNGGAFSSSSPIASPMLGQSRSIAGGSGGSSANIENNFYITVNTTQPVDGDKIVKQALDRLKKESYDGKLMISKKGIG